MEGRFEPLHQPFFCEENVWHLCKEPLLADRPRLVVFVSNADQSLAMWEQRAARAGAPVLWDYHVMLFVGRPWEAWDLDSRLPVPTPALEYLARSFREGIPEEFMPRFRLVEADDFVRIFASDRSHMRDAKGRFRRPPPPWKPIGVPDRESNLERFLDVGTPFLGEVLDLEAMVRRFEQAETR